MSEDNIRKYEDSEWKIAGPYSNGDFWAYNKIEKMSASIGQFEVTFFNGVSRHIPFEIGIPDGLSVKDKEVLLDVRAARRDDLNSRKKRVISALERLTGVNYNPYSVREW